MGPGLKPHLVNTEPPDIGDGRLRPPVSRKGDKVRNFQAQLRFSFCNWRYDSNNKIYTDSATASYNSANNPHAPSHNFHTSGGAFLCPRIGPHYEGQNTITKDADLSKPVAGRAGGAACTARSARPLSRS